MKTLINSSLMKWFRKSFLTKIHSDILYNKKYYCCKVNSWHSFFICWKNLKEVKENMNSKELKEITEYSCNFSWFYNKVGRLEFLKECLMKF